MVSDEVMMEVAALLDQQGRADIVNRMANSALTRVRYQTGCVNCKRGRSALHRHHVTYEPEHVELLCKWCHAAITLVNLYAARSVGRKLLNNERERVWEEFLKGFAAFDFDDK